MSRRWLGVARRTFRWTRWLALALLFPTLLAVAFGQWWVLPRLNQHREAVAAALGDYLHAPAHIESISAEPDGWRLDLRLHGLSLHDPETRAALIRFDQVAATLDVWRSLREWRPAFGPIRLEGVSLTLEQGMDGMPRLRADASAADFAPSLPEVARWLFEVGRLDLVGDRLTVRRQEGDALHILHPGFQVRETSSSQRLAFTAELPAELGGRVQLRVERSRVDPEFWGGTFELRADRLSLAGGSLPLAFANGRADLEVRGDWRDWRPTRLEGRLRLSEAELTRPHRLVGLERWLTHHPQMELTLEGQRQGAGWQGRGGARFSDGKGRVRAHPTFEFSQSGEQWRGAVRDLRVQDVAAWVSPWLDESARQGLASLEPQGELPEITVQAEAATGAYAVTAQLHRVATQPFRGLPGLDKLAGTLEITPDQGRITLDSRKVRVDTAGLLRAPIMLDALKGAVSWTRAADGLRLTSTGLDFANADLNARVWGSVTVPAQGGPPLLDLQTRYRDVKVGAARRYLPATVIPPKALAWLDRALVGGRVTTGEGVLRGPANAFPFDQGQGLFEIRFQLEDAVLDYTPGWPRLEAARGTVQFNKRGLQVEIVAGRLLDVEVEKLGAWIDNLASAVVEVKGRAKGPGASLWRAFKSSPAGQDLGEDLPELRIAGASMLDLGLTIPVDPRPNQVRGQVSFLDNQVVLPAWNLEFNRLRGELRFTEAGLEARELQARLRGEPVRLDLDLDGPKDRRDLRARLRGRLGPSVLASEPAAKELARVVSGKSLWDAVVTVPTRRRERRDHLPSFTLALNSDLRGMAVRLPAPLGKTADEAHPLTLHLRPREREVVDLMLDDGEGVRAALELADFPRDPRLARGELRINAGAAKLPEASGLTVVAELPRWELTGFPTAPEDAAGAWRGLRRLDARIGELMLGRQVVANVALNAVRREEDVQIEFDGETLAGRVTLPDAPSPEQPVNVALQRLHLRQAAKSALSNSQDTDAAIPNPRQMPPLALAVTDLRWNGAELGRLQLTALPRPDGIRLTELTLDSKRQRIAASGDWRQASGGQISRLRATLQSPALGETLAAFGYAGVGIARGETEAELAVEWAGALAEFALERLEGTLKLAVGPGQLLDVDPGMGRMVGLFNVQNLLRRLTLDFSDLMQPGMSFDRMTGKFAFKRGQAYTDDLTIEAPAARIEIKGRTNLKERDYDQRITVIPRLGGALPVAGALAGGPAVGAAVLLAERLLQKGIEQATQYRYALTGSWDQPVMELVEEPSSASPAKGLVGDK